VATVLAVLVVAAVAAVVSYEHMRAVSAGAGEGWRSWLLPLSVDGLIVAASMVMLTRRAAGRPAGPLAWGSLVLGIAASVAANVASADSSVTSRVVAAWSPVALLLSVELLLQLLHARPTGSPRSS
jgi:lipopolysaccharide export LptBFGC system permease protein LptF